MRLPIAFITLALLAGCATHQPLSALPQSKDEYQLNRKALAEKYPDIATYSAQWRGWSPNFPPEEDVVARLGKPERIERNWWYVVSEVVGWAAVGFDPIMAGVILAVTPDIPKRYYFDKENYCIEATMARTLFNGYQPHMQSWSWDENKKKCKAGDGGHAPDAVAEADRIAH